MSGTLTFGCRAAEHAYTQRRAGYAVVIGENRKVAAILGSRTQFWLPGGGCEPGESYEDAISREVREELGRPIRLLRHIGQVVQYFYAAGEKQHYEMEAMFFLAEFAEGSVVPCEYELHWLPADEWDRGFFHECHAWAARQVLPGAH